ncbi:MAG: DEAD/DEAH box helicase [Phycisphaerae bacterium]|nr:DEAD/DEAH box helicase [Phycisphaerae bacterium]
MSLEEWQTLLRREYGRSQLFGMKNLGEIPVFSDFAVTNPQSGSTYRVTIRGAREGDNSCTCFDFRTNSLGTCKHIEYALGRIARRAEGAKLLRQGRRAAHSEVVLRYGSRREVRFLPGTECPPALLDASSRFFDAMGILKPSGFGVFDEFQTLAERAGHLVRFHEDALGFIAEVRDSAERRRRIDAAFPKGAESQGFEKLLSVPLYQYQREGALFAARAGRCIIGDEMGLGKTVQAIAAAEIMAGHLGVSRVLVVCPTSLKHQWEREVRRFTKREAVVINGLSHRRREQFEGDGFFKITNYDTIHRDLDLVAAWSPDLVILDEAQRIKNWSTRAARAVKRIASPFGIVLTGTPLENRLEELVSIVQFVDQHRLGPTYKFLAEHQQRDDDGRVIGFRDLDRIGRTLAPVLIRRRKSEVLRQLPGRLDKNFFVAMTPEQRAMHEEHRSVVARIVAKWRKIKYLSESDQRRLMVALQAMRMSCNSTYLLDPSADHGVKADEFITLAAEWCERPEVKIVVFSQWLRTHELLAKRLAARGIGHVLFHGGVPSRQRGEVIDRFREDPACRVFLSTDAGGVGLNLQSASIVVNMDLPWNPAVLEQRIGRVHRLGQERPVQVVNFISQGTIEEGMLNVIRFKKSLFGGVLDGGASEVFLGGSRLSRFIESVDKATGAIPQPPPAEPPLDPEPEGRPQRGRAHRGSSAVHAETAALSVEPKPGAEGSWSGVASAGLELLRELANRNPGHDARSASLLRTDPITGEKYLHIPAPRPEVLERFLAAAAELLGGVNGKNGGTSA